MNNKDLIVAYLSSIVQVCNYALFGYAITFLAAEYMPPSTNSIVSIFALLGATSIAKPIGALIYGIIGDYYSRRLAIRSASLFSTLAVIFIGLIPAYEKIGILSSILFIICRSVFVMGLIGETDGVRIYIFETVSKYNKNLANGIITCCWQIGSLLAILLLVLQYSWRLCFITGGILGLFMFFQSKYLKVSNDIKTTLKVTTIGKLIQSCKLIIQYWYLLIPCILIHGCIGAIYSFQLYFFPVYITKMLYIIEYDYIRFIILLALLLYSLMAVWSGYLADKYCLQYQTIFFALMLSIVCSVINMVMIFNYQKFLPTLYIISILLIPFYSVPLQVKVCNLFSNNNRLRLFSLSHSIGSVLISSQIGAIAALAYNKANIMPMLILILLFFILGFTVLIVIPKMQ
ncbi:sugar (and other) transporter family protein [Orientia chuto str. Dubai]|uniref:Sugar (And other) transporter family protein n=1 Tax=Orientia chuto str. Dubai TaxID=1359168 RepID=A0A0F3MGS9_9RICK|nr:MFS transporter [Candidatus Orientia mediorientalis]KJV54965.1 sugar (and other) transporter family protein [Orientia chuto str. Dubai]